MFAEHPFILLILPILLINSLTVVASHPFANHTRQLSARKPDLAESAVFVADFAKTPRGGRFYFREGSHFLRNWDHFLRDGDEHFREEDQPKRQR